MSRAAQDSVIDDDEETCPLCIEEFDLSDKNFKPCPCGYQICQFCFNSLKTTYEKSTCPNCRRPYDERTIQYKIPTAEDIKLDQQNKNRKQAAAKRKETEKREVENSNRRNLAGVRVKQMNLVYVIGLVPSIKDETSLLQTLRGPDYFGQYGEIEKIVVSKAKPNAPNQGIGVYVTYARKEDAALCIQTVDGSLNGERVLRAQYGTTKYCSAFLRGENCNNKNCSFLHETGEDGQGSSLQYEQNSKSATKPLPSHTSQLPPPARAMQSSTPVQHSSQPMARQGSADEPNSRKGSTDGPALPTSASWAGISQITKTRRGSQAASRATPSPQFTASVPSTKSEESKIPKDYKTTLSQVAATTLSTKTSTPKPIKVSDSLSERQANWDRLLKKAMDPNFRFVFDESMFTKEELEELDNYPSFIDPYGGAKQRIMLQRQEERRKKEAAEMEAARQQQVAQSAIDDTEEEHLGSGSLALGGEPEENPRSASARGAIGRPLQSTSASNFVSDQFANLNLNGRTVTPQQRQQTGISRAPGFGQHPSQFGTDMFDMDRSSQFAHQQHDPMHGHQRQNSRYFNNDVKSAAGGRFQSQQPSLYQSGVQGPPPGLATTGTPPFSGGGRFAHGQGFTSNVNTGFGGMKDVSSDSHHRGRSGTNEISKRELLLPLQNPLRSPPLQASAPGLLNPLYSQFAGTYQDPGLVKQKKKGKKHRHANTSSSGGGVVDLADPSILQARVHQGGAGSGQGLFGGGQVDEREFPSLPSSTVEKAKPFHSRVSSFQSPQRSVGRTPTPKIPPGFETNHGHPTPQRSTTPPIQSKGLNILPVVPAIPNLSATQPSVSSKVAELVDERAKVTAEKGKQSNYKTSKQSKSEKDFVKQRTRSGGEISPGHTKFRDSEVTGDSQKDGNKTNEVRGTQAVRSERKTGDIKSQVEHPTAEDAGKDKVLHIADTEVRNEPVSRDDSKSKKTPTPTLGSATAAPSQISTSRPETPVTSYSDASKTSAKRPMTIRVTTNPSRPADSVPASAVTEKSMTLPSLTKPLAHVDSAASPSQSRPSTPAVSDRFSADVSRASSPPPSVVGSAPERTKTKAQQKKERKEKAKKIAETSDSNAPASTAIAEEVAPVIGRQRKQRKHKDEPSKSKASITKESKARDSVDDNSAVQGEGEEMVESEKVQALKDALEPTSEPTQAEVEKDLAADKVEPAPPKPEMSYFTIGDLFDESKKRLKEDPGLSESAVLHQIISEHLRPITQILGDMLEEGQFDPKSALFNPPPLTSAAFKLPPDPRKGQEYLAANGYTDSNPFGTIYLGTKEKQALLRGQDVSVSDENRPDDLLRRALVTGWGTVYRHLSTDEEERAVSLEEKREEWHAEWGERMGLGLMEDLDRLEDHDYNNIEGDVGDLVKFGGKFGIGWVKGPAGQLGGHSHDHHATGQQSIGDEDEDELDEALAAAAAAAVGHGYNGLGTGDDEGEYEEDDDDEVDEEEGNDDGEDDEDGDDDDLGMDLDPAWRNLASSGTFGITTSGPKAKVNHAGASLAHTPLTAGATTAPDKFNPRVDTRNMTMEQLAAREDECLREMEAAKRELERVERLVKMNNRDVLKFLARVPGYPKV